MTEKEEAVARLEDIVSLSDSVTDKARAAQAAVQRIFDEASKPERNK